MLNELAIIGAKYLIFMLLGLAVIWLLMQPRNRQKEFLVFAVIALPLMYLVLLLAGWIYYDPRPFVVGHFVPLIAHAANNGFPSDHTMLSSAIAVLVFPYSKKMGVLFWIMAVLVAASRVYVGVHHVVDVLASMLIAIVVGYLTYKFLVPSFLRRTVQV